MEWIEVWGDEQPTYKQPVLLIYIDRFDKYYVSLACLCDDTWYKATIKNGVVKRTAILSTEDFELLYWQPIDFEERPWVEMV